MNKLIYLDQCKVYNSIKTNALPEKEFHSFVFSRYSHEKQMLICGHMPGEVVLNLSDISSKGSTINHRGGGGRGPNQKKNEQNCSEHL